MPVLYKKKLNFINNSVNRYNKIIIQLQREEEPEKQERPTLTNPPALVRQGTETLRRERPQSQLVAPRDVSRCGEVGKRV